MTGADFKIKTVDIDGTRVMLQVPDVALCVPKHCFVWYLPAVQIWDIAMQDKFQSMTEYYFKGARAVVLGYDITNEVRV